jgi:spore coat protein U-like protein
MKEPSMKQSLLLTASCALAFGLTVPTAHAATYTNGTAISLFNVTLTVQPNCFVAVQALSFGTVGLLTNPVLQQTTASVTCTNSTPYNFGIDAGNTTGSTVPNRLMAGTSSGNTSTVVSFQIFQDAGLKTVWGNTQGTNTVAGTGTGSAQTYTLFGEVPAQASPNPDTYHALLTGTIFF